MKITGDLTITSENAHLASVLASVSGILRVYINAEFPALTKCGGVRAYDSATVILPALTECRGVLAYDSATVSLPALTECRDVWTCDSATVSLPALTECRDVWTCGSATVSLPVLTECRDVRAYDSATVSLPLIGAIIASDGEYSLFRKHSGTYHAGCRQGLTAKQALAHWGSRTDERAKVFTAAIEKAERAAKP